MPAPLPITRLRAALAFLLASGNEDATWLAQGIERYQAEAPDGATLDGILGLSRSSGAGPWWKAEARARRDAAVRDLHATSFADLGVTEAATAIIRTVRRRQLSRTPAATRSDVLADRVLLTGVSLPSTKRQVASILREEPGNPTLSPNFTARVSTPHP